jgi:hypothetical protein
MARTTFLWLAGAGLILAALIGVFAGASRADISPPNSSGYVWTDTNAPAPQTTFEWIDATDGTALSGLACDDCAATVTLPFNFNFFGADYSTAAISSNGFLSFNSADPMGCNINFNWGPDDLGNGIPHGDASCLDDGWGANPLIASWFDDFNPTACGSVFYEVLGSAPNRTFVVEFVDVCHIDCSSCTAREGITFETILFEGSNDIKIQYMDAFFGTGDPLLEAANNGASATTGLSKDGTTGLQYSWNTATITDGLAVLYTTAEPTTGTPEPSPTDTSEASPTATSTETPSPTDTPEPSPPDTPEPTPTDTPEPSPTDTPEPSPTETPEPSSTETPEPTPTDTPTSTPEPSPTDTPEPTPTATPTETPSPTATPTETPTPTPGPIPDAAVTLVPNADKTNTGDWKNQDSNTCGVVACNEALDEDIDSAIDSDFIYSVPDPVDRSVEFELENAPADLATVTGITVRFRAFKQGPKDVSALVEVFNFPDFPLGLATPQTLDEVPTTYSYSMSGIALSAQDVDGLFVRVTANTAPGAGLPTTVILSAINLDIDYVTAPTPTASSEPTLTPTPTATPEPPTDTPEPATDTPAPTPTATPTETPAATPSETPMATPTPTPTPTPALGFYHPVVPSRILDTRSAPQGVPAGKVGPDAEITVDVTGGASGVPADGVSAVVINATGTQATDFTYLTVHASDEPRPPTSNLNFGPGQDVANLVTVKVGSDGNVKVYNAVGSTHLVVDVVGWYGGPTDGSRFNSVNPKRILSTRDGIGAPTAKIGANASLVVDVTAVYGSGVPGSGVTAVVVNTTVSEATDASYLTVYPSDAGPPLASNLNFAAGQTVANLVTVKVGADGNVLVYNAVGSTHVILDVVGWYGASGDLFHPITPSRILDTRTSPQANPVGKAQANAEISVDVTVGSIPDNASGVIVNTTATQGTAPSYLTVYPSGVGLPLASNLNFKAGQDIPNLVIVGVGTGGNVQVYNKDGQVHIIFDAVGYFAP